MVESLQNAERRQKPSLDYLFEDVYDSLPENLKEQAKNTRKIALNHANDYPTDVPLEWKPCEQIVSMVIHCIQGALFIYTNLKL